MPLKNAFVDVTTNNCNQQKELEERNMSERE
jgi:hypothetical protein